MKGRYFSGLVKEKLFRELQGNLELDFAGFTGMLHCTVLPSKTIYVLDLDTVLNPVLVVQVLKQKICANREHKLTHFCYH